MKTISNREDSFNLAAIDIGSNAARLLIKRVTRQEDGSLQFQKLQFVRFPLRLGLDVFTHGKISKEREAKFLHMIKAFRHLMLIYDVVQYRACATSALRDARNGKKIISRIKEETGINIEIITGDEEARIIYNNHIENLVASSSNVEEGIKSYLYVDVGGGSTEVSFISGGELKASRSFNIGTLRLLSGLVNQDSISAMCSQVKSMIGESNNVEIIGSGGNINKLYRLVPKKEKLKDMISLSQVTELYGQLSSLTVEDRMRDYDLRADRADVIVPAAQIFITVAKAAGSDNILVPTVGLADGIINQLVVSSEK